MGITGEEALAVANSYTDETVIGGGAIKGKNCTVKSIADITGGHRVTFEWTLDNGTVQTNTMDVMNGIDGQDGQDGKGIKSVAINEEEHLIITYTDDTTTDAGKIEVQSAVDSVNGQTGAVTLDAEDVGALPDNTLIPTKTSDLTNDSGFITSADVPTKTSDLTNDSNFVVDASYVHTDNNYDATAKGIVDGVTSALSNKVDKVTGKGLSTNDYSDADKAIVDGVTSALAGKADVADIPSKTSDLTNDSGFATTSDVSTALADYTTTSDLTTLLTAKQDTLTFDNVPTENSNNPVKSGGVFTSEQNIYAVMGENGAKNAFPLDLEAIKNTSGNTNGTWNGDAYTINGITYTFNGDGTITGNGTASANARIMLVSDNGGGKSPCFLKPDTDYILSCENIKSIGGSNAGAILSINEWDGTQYVSSPTVGDYTGKNEWEFTTKSSAIAESMRALLEVKNGVILNNFVFKPMVRLASDTDSTYQPYAKTNQELTAEYEALTNNVDVLNKNGAINMLPNNATSRTINGVTFTVNDDGSVTANGTASAVTEFPIITKILILKAGNYILSTKNNLPTNVYFSIYITGQGWKDITNDANSVEFSKNSDIEISQCRLYIANGVTLSDFTFYPMIADARYNGNYVPYSKTNRELTEDSVTWHDLSEVGAVNYAKNNFVVSYTSGITFTLNDDKTVTATGTAAANSSFKAEFTLPKGTYRLSGCPSGGSDITYRITLVGALSSVLTEYGEGVIFTITENKAVTLYCDVRNGYAISDSLIFNPMIAPVNYNGDYVPPAKTNKELTEELTVTNFQTVTSNGLTFAFSKVGHVAMCTFMGSASADIAGNTDIATIPSGYRPVVYQTDTNTTNKLPSTGDYMRMFLMPNGDIQAAGSITTGDPLRGSVTYPCE